MWRPEYIDDRGYVRVYCPDHPKATKKNPYVAKHKLVIEKQIGRYLTKNEVIHHINGNKQDNRIKNLQRLSNSEHSHLHHYGRKRSKTDENTRCVDCGEITKVMKPNPIGGRPYPYWFFADKEKKTRRCHRCYYRLWMLKNKFKAR